MKKIANLTKSMLLMTLAITLFAVAPVKVDNAYDPSGDWTYEIEIPEQGAISGDMTIKKEGEGWDVVVETDDYGTLNLQDVELDGTDMTGTVEVAGGLADFEMEFDGDSMEGVIYFGEDELPITAERDSGN